MPRLYIIVPWLTLGACVIGSFLITGMLTSKGLLGTNEFDETGVPCRCRGIAGGKDVEMDWLLLVCMTMVFKWFVFQPVILLVATCLHLRSANRLAAEMAVCERAGGEEPRKGEAGYDDTRALSSDAYKQEERQISQWNDNPIIIAKAQTVEMKVFPNGGGKGTGTGTGGAGRVESQGKTETQKVKVSDPKHRLMASNAFQRDSVALDTAGI